MQQKPVTFTKYNPGKNAYIAWAVYLNKNLVSIVIARPYYHGGVYIEKFYERKTERFVSELHYSDWARPVGELKIVEVNSEIDKEVELAIRL